MEWGTVGEWVSGLAVIVAALALRLEIGERRAETRRRREEAGRAAWEAERRVARRISVWSGRRMKGSTGEWYQEVLFSNSSDETVRSLSVRVEFRGLDGFEALEERFSGPLRPAPLDSVNVFLPREWAERAGGFTTATPRYAEGASGLTKRLMDEEAEVSANQELEDAIDDWMTSSLGEAVVSARFEDHEGRLWRKDETGDLERLDGPNEEQA